jgi:hypothetical protein
VKIDMNHPREGPEVKREYSKFEMIFGNFAIILWILVGTWACWLFFLPAAVGFLVLVAFLVYYKLGKKGCLNCYYCKTCTIGIGKLPEFFFAKNGTANVNGKALKLFPLVYLLLSAVPIILLSISIIREISAYKFALLSLALLFSVYTGFIRRKILLK